MCGSSEEHGIMGQSVHRMCEIISQSDEETALAVSYLEIYNEDIKDLLAQKGSKKPRVRNAKRGSSTVDNLETRLVTNVQQVLDIVQEGERRRHYGRTAMNDFSSRSHTILMVRIARVAKADSIAGGRSKARQACLNLVDLAGSERQSTARTSGTRFTEGKYINKSLSNLSHVMNKLSEGTHTHIPFRDSILTRILEPSLGGNARTAVICAVSPAINNVETTISTLRFGESATHVCNCATINEVEIGDSLLMHQKRMSMMGINMESDEEKEKKEEKERQQRELERQQTIRTREMELKKMKMVNKIAYYIMNKQFDRKQVHDAMYRRHLFIVEKMWQLEPFCTIESSNAGRQYMSKVLGQTTHSRDDMCAEIGLVTLNAQQIDFYRVRFLEGRNQELEASNAKNEELLSEFANESKEMWETFDESLREQEKLNNEVSALENQLCRLKGVGLHQLDEATLRSVQRKTAKTASRAKAIIDIRKGLRWKKRVLATVQSAVSAADLPTSAQVSAGDINGTGKEQDHKALADELVDLDENGISDDLWDMLESQEDEFENLQGKIGALTDQLADMEKQLQQQTEENFEQTQQIAAKDARIAALEEDVQQAQENEQQLRDEHQVQMSALQAKLEKASARLEELERKEKAAQVAAKFARMTVMDMCTSSTSSSSSGSTSSSSTTTSSSHSTPVKDDSSTASPASEFAAPAARTVFGAVATAASASTTPQFMSLAQISVADEAPVSHSATSTPKAKRKYGTITRPRRSALNSMASPSSATHPRTGSRPHSAKNDSRHKPRTVAPANASRTPGVKRRIPKKYHTMRPERSSSQTSLNGRRRTATRDDRKNTQARPYVGSQENSSRIANMDIQIPAHLSQSEPRPSATNKTVETSQPTDEWHSGFASAQ
jgi:Kinesin motor domain